MHRSPALPDRAHRRSPSAAVRAVSVTAGAVAAVVACTLATPAAAVVAAPAEPGAGGAVEVAPRHAEPGTQVELSTDLCGTEDTAFATSVAFEADVDLQRTRDGSAFHGYAMVSADAELGTYGLTVVCGEDAGRGEGSFKVVPASEGGGTEDGSGYDHGIGRGYGDGGTGQDEGAYGEGGHAEGGYGDGSGRHPYEPRDPYASPVAPVRAGGGGTAGDPVGGATDASQRVGLALAGGAAVAGAVTWAVRRRRAGAHTGG